VFTPEKNPLDSLGDLTGFNLPWMVNIDHFCRSGGFASMKNRMKRRNTGQASHWLCGLFESRPLS